MEKPGKTWKNLEKHELLLFEAGERLDLEASMSGARGSRIKDPGPCPAMNGHHRRDTDFILRQSKALLELFNSR